MFDYIRVAAATPRVSVADVKKNTANIKAQIDEARASGADVIAFPELSVSAYSCGDLFFQHSLIKSVENAVLDLCEYTRGHGELVFVGAPIKLRSQLYNTAIALQNGVIRGIVPKMLLSGSGEFNEGRYFASGSELCEDIISSAHFGCEEEYDIPIGEGLVFSIGDNAKIGCEICEDLWAPISPSAFLALGGAEVVVNLTASNETVSKRSNRYDLVKNQSSKLLCGYVMSCAGCSESTTDLVFSGHSVICENGRVLAESEDKILDCGMLVCDIDLEKIRYERGRETSFRRTMSLYCSESEICEIECEDGALSGDGSLYPIRKNPFVPNDENELKARCKRIFDIQVSSLKKRLEVTGAKAVVGISGGLDSTLALLVCCEAMRRMGRDATDVVGITMPCFGTTSRTYNNSLELMRLLGVDAIEINIKDAVKAHFADIGQDEACHDTTYENAQARERTQVLMDYAGRIGGLVVGTGDLSELCLGWCTYNADHMSMYGVNGGVPKTLIPHIIKTVSEQNEFECAKGVLADILDTPISPELLPPSESGDIAQKTQDLVGPYALHDFFIYYALRYGFSPSKIYSLALRAFEGEYDRETIKKWLKTFYRRFFSQQYKRSCLPDGAKIGSVGISPRGELKMPSDASASLWLCEIEKL